MTGGHPRRGEAGDESMVSMGNVPGERAKTIRECEGSSGECRQKGQGGETAELSSRTLLEVSLRSLDFILRSERIRNCFIKMEKNLSLFLLPKL